ncbi:MAG: Lipoprotein signal peptidase [Saprospiraceae bacterium]|jgi:signal peptidase II|nr:Lipoprotein signal peptidase [Saprospiraceae bacterium]
MCTAWLFLQRMKNRTAWLIALGTMIALLIIDQSSKIWVKTHMEMGEEFSIFGLEWARIHFVENEGMAFGMSFGGATGKLLLSLFRIVAVTFLFFLLYRMIDGDEHLPSVVSFSMILAGASGNILDSMFYGLIFSASPYHGGVAELFPDGGGYAPFLMGKVVDMFYFPLFTIDLPAWVPIWGGGPFEFFRPVFNVADASIFCGICTFLLFYKKPKPDSGASPVSEG